MKTIACKIPEKLDAELAAIAREEGTTTSEVVRNAISDRVARRRRKKPFSAYDLVSDLVGTVDGPADLLTNPACSLDHN